MGLYYLNPHHRKRFPPLKQGKVASADFDEAGRVKYNSIRLLTNLSVTTSRDCVSLRLGHATALTVHLTVIHYRVDTALPNRGDKIYFLLTLGQCDKNYFRFIYPYNTSQLSCRQHGRDPHGAARKEAPIRGQAFSESNGFHTATEK